MKYIIALLAALCILSAHHEVIAQASNEHAVMPVECKIALHIVSNVDYVREHSGEIPDEEKMDNISKSEFVANLFKESIRKQDNPVQFCTNTIRENLHYTNAYHFPQQCLEFIPLLQKSFEEKISYTKDAATFVRNRMDDSIIDMLVLDEVAPDRLIARCEVGIKVMKVDLNDKHLEEKYPLPPTCEAFFSEMEKTLLLPSELITLRRQRVLFAIENKNTPEKLTAICEEISH